MKPMTEYQRRPRKHGLNWYIVRAIGRTGRYVPRREILENILPRAPADDYGRHRQSVDMGK